MAGFTFRPVEKEDGTSLCAVHRAAILVLGRHAYSEEEVESWAHDLSTSTDVDAMESEGQSAEVAVDETGTVVAFCSLKEDEVKALYVHPDAADKGVDGALTARAEVAIAAAGYRTVRVEASASGLAFHKRLGYRRIEAFDFSSRSGLTM